MRNTIDNIVNRVVKSIINEGDFKRGDSIVIPGGQATARKIIKAKYGLKPDDFEYVGGGRYIYTAKPKKSSKKAGQAKAKNDFIGKKEGESDEDYLQRVRSLNSKFADLENEMPGEEWRPVKNTGRYFGGTSDYTKTHEVSNMGRMRTIDFNDPMKSRISTGYDAPTRNARQFHLDTFGNGGETQKTTPPIHTMVADAWLDAPEGNIEDYDVGHIDGDYHNNRADNLRYVLRKGRRSKKANDDMSLSESVRRMIMESVRRALK